MIYKLNTLYLTKVRNKCHLFVYSIVNAKLFKYPSRNLDIDGIATQTRLSESRIFNFAPRINIDLTIFSEDLVSQCAFSRHTIYNL